jgi:hypothetical protein
MLLQDARPANNNSIGLKAASDPPISIEASVSTVFPDSFFMEKWKGAESRERVKFICFLLGRNQNEVKNEKYFILFFDLSCLFSTLILNLSFNHYLTDVILYRRGERSGSRNLWQP